MIRVTCAIIRNEENEVLIVQRGELSDHPFKWEFPGGKVRAGESEEESIIREIREELSIGIVICSRQADVEYDYGIKQIRLIPFVCDTLDEVPFLTEHSAYKWISAEQLKEVDFVGADIIVADHYAGSMSLTDSPAKENVRTEEVSTDDSGLRSMIADIMGMKNAEWIAASAAGNPEMFRKLVEFSYSRDKKLAFRSSWILTKSCDTNPTIVYPYLDAIIESLEKIENESVERSFLRILSLSDLKRLNSRQHGLLADHCFEALKSAFSAIAVKAYSMEILYRLALIYPELTYELSVTISMLQGEGSAGIVARGNLILKKLAGFSGEKGTGKRHNH